MIRSNFAGWSGLVDQVLATLTDDDLAASPYPHFRHPIPRSSHLGAMTLLGDAAHAMPPILAQGTNQALLDTMVLCKALSDFRNPANRSSGDLSRALRWYERTRRRRLTAVSWVTSRQMSQSEAVLKPAAMVSDSFGTWAMTTFLRSISHRRISAEVSRDLSSRLIRC
jgi:2-polyprenyl-6-methoxyphenol hydroxylase-like FAD-dependent oxidoreductase